MYELEQVGKNTYYINCPAKIGIYCLPNQDVILIDSGNDKEAGKKVLKILENNNWKLNAIINTHSNADHIGGNKLLSERTGCKIYTTKLEGAFTEFPIIEASFLYGGYPNKLLRNKFLFAQASEFKDINELRLPDGMEILSLKGHFFDMIGVKTPDDVYFMADCVLSQAIINKYHISFIYDVAEYLNTLDKIELLSGKCFVPAHAEVTESMSYLAKINREKVNEIMEKIKVITKAPVTFEIILKNIFDCYNLTMDFNQYVLVGSTIRSYLSYMLDNRLIKCDFIENQLFWKTL